MHGGGALESFKVKHAKTIVYFGTGALVELEPTIKTHKKIGVITGSKSARISGALNDLEDILNKHSIEYKLYEGIRPNPTLAQCEEAVNVLKNEGIDAIVGIGGGSVLDTAKIIASSLGDGQPCSYYVEERGSPSAPLPLYVINLTHGTGSEVDRYSVVNISHRREKRGLITVYPSIGIDDPKYTVSLPKFQTMITTFDAFYHSIESSTGPRSNPLVRDLSRNAVERIAVYLERALSEPGDLVARYNLLYSSMLAGISIDYAGTHIIHLIEHGLSGVNDRLEHASGLAIIGPRLLPYVHRKSPQYSSYILKPLSNEIKAIREHAELAGKIVEDFQQSMGFEKTLGDYGFDKSDLIEAVDKVWKTAVKLWGEKPFGISRETVLDMLEDLL